MGKHVCPVCETVHATKGTVILESRDRSKECEAWECPACGYRFVSLSDLRDLLTVRDEVPVTE
jgi:hypothetical protein